jgi:NADH:ubiquinone reductase (H+-translocating)
MLNTRLTGVTSKVVSLNNDNRISSSTIIWAGGAKPDPLISSLQCEHDNIGRIITNNYLEVQGQTDSVFALGDCASIMDPKTGHPYPPSAMFFCFSTRWIN